MLLDIGKSTTLAIYHNKALHHTNQCYSELSLSLYHEFLATGNILIVVCVSFYGNKVKHWDLIISCMAKWSIFQNPVTN